MLSIADPICYNGRIYLQEQRLATANDRRRNDAASLPAAGRARHVTRWKWRHDLVVRAGRRWWAVIGWSSGAACKLTWWILEIHGPVAACRRPTDLDVDQSETSLQTHTTPLHTNALYLQYHQYRHHIEMLNVAKIISIMSRTRWISQNRWV